MNESNKLLWKYFFKYWPLIILAYIFYQVGLANIDNSNYYPNIIIAGLIIVTHFYLGVNGAIKEQHKRKNQSYTELNKYGI